MIKLFRRIRYRLLSENKSGKYLEYALGEIILVVIGILIALQINNWNEARKRRNLEIEIYKELYTDLSKTLEEVQSDRDAHIYLLQCLDSLIHHINAQRPYNDHVVDQLLCSAGDLQVYPKTSGFDALKSIGLDLLTNDTIRSAVTDLYQLQLERVVKQGKEYTQVNNLQSIMGPFLDNYLTVDLDQESTREVQLNQDSSIFVTSYGYKIRRYDDLLNNKKLMAQLSRVQAIRRNHIGRHIWVSRKIEAAMSHIEDELARIDRRFEGFQ